MDGKFTLNGKSYTITEDAPPPPPISATGLLLVPFDVTPTVVKLDALAGWTGEHDGATGGTAKGVTTYPVTIGGRTARAFPSDYTKWGGLRYHVVYDTDAKARNFVYAGDLWIDDPTQIGQMELDNNQVVNGKTIIYGVQCNANSGFWEVTIQDPKCRWIQTKAKGNPKLWPAKQWLHFELACHRDDLGNVTYDAIHFNGLTQQIGITLPSAQAMGWTPEGVLLVNVQEGGANVTGASRVYGSNLVIVRW